MEYRGTVNTTISGRSCRAWSTKEADYADTSDHNFCRNPSQYTVSRGVWCYTDGDPHWEHCDVPFCPTMDPPSMAIDQVG